MKREKIIGKCRICGREGPLSFEHIPPRAAFNNRPVVRVSLQQLIELGPNIKPRGPVDQKGMGYYCLCIKCNNDTGSWYAPRFIDWCYRGMEILNLSRGNPNLVYVYKIFPLSIIKQIVVMLLAINNPGFAEAQKELSIFVMDKNNNHLPKQFRIYTYYNILGIHRKTGLSARLQIPTGDVVLMAEISFPPYGYLFTINSPKPDDRLLDITGWCNYRYDDLVEIEIKMAVLPTYLLYPGDYRTKEEIMKAKEKHNEKNA